MVSVVYMMCSEYGLPNLVLLGCGVFIVRCANVYLQCVVYKVYNLVCLPGVVVGGCSVVVSSKTGKNTNEFRSDQYFLKNMNLL